jgi:hypothetical protein
LGVSELRTIRNERRNELGQAQALDVSALPDGSTIQSDLETALEDSIANDTAIINWGRQDEASGCSTAEPYDVTTTNNAANGAKANFGDVWNPVAAEYNQPAETTGTF